MKKSFSLAIVALFVSVTASGQIGESKSMKIETTYTTTTTTTVDVPLEVPNKNYDRYHLGLCTNKINL